MRQIKGTVKTRLMVRVRDNFTCQDCGHIRPPESVGKGKEFMKNLDVHHLNGLCGIPARKTTYDPITNIPFLITLCHKCHYNRNDHAIKARPKKVRERSYVPTERSRLSTEKHAQVLVLYKRGLNTREIGEKVSLTRQRVSQILIKENLYVGRTPTPDKVCPFCRRSYKITYRNKMNKACSLKDCKEERHLIVEERRKAKARERANIHYQKLKRLPNWRDIVRERNRKYQRKIKPTGYFHPLAS